MHLHLHMYRVASLVNLIWLTVQLGAQFKGEFIHYLLLLLQCFHLLHSSNLVFAQVDEILNISIALANISGELLVLRCKCLASSNATFCASFSYSSSQSISSFSSPLNRLKA